MDEVAVREYVLQMDGFTIDHPAKHFNKNTKTQGKDYDKGLAVSH